jgi:hypothetical protein
MAEALAVLWANGKYFKKLEIWDAHCMSRPQLGSVLHTRQRDVEVAAFDRRRERRPRNLHELRVSPEAARDHAGDFDIHPAHTRRIGRIGFDERSPTLGVAAPAKRAARRTARRRALAGAEQYGSRE